MNTTTIGGRPVYDPPANYAGPPLNAMTLTTGASRPGCGTFLMTRRDVQALAGANARLVMRSDPRSGASADQVLDVAVLVGGAVPFEAAVDRTGVAATENRKSDMVRVTVYDARADLLTPKRVAYNVQRSGFHHDSTPAPLFYPSTLNAGSEWTWTTLLGNVGVTATLPDDVPTSWKPRNLIYDGVPVGRVVDDVAARLFYVAGFDFAASGLAAVRLFKPGQSLDANTTLLAKAAKFRIAGAAAERETLRLPANVDVVFPGHDLDSDDPFANRAYVTTVATGYAGGFTQALHAGEYVATRRGGAWLASAALDTVAADLVARWKRAVTATTQEVAYAGIWPFRPDGAIRSVTWASDRFGARTVLAYHNGRDFDAAGAGGGDRRNVQLPSNELVAGLGGSRAAMAQSGTRYVWADAAAGGVAVRAAAAGTPGGKYTGFLAVQPTTNFNPAAGNLAATDISSADGQAVNLVVASEIGTSNHGLQTGANGFYVGAVVGSDPDDGKPVVLVAERLPPGTADGQVWQWYASGGPAWGFVRAV